MIKKFLFIFTISLLLPQLAWAKVQVVSTIPMLAALAQAVGGERVEVKSIARPDQDPHFLQPKPSYVVLLNRADLLVVAGLSLEIGWLPVAITQSRNPKIQKNAPGYVDASQGIPRLEVPTGKLDRSAGDVHPEGNPHYFLDPRSGFQIAKTIFNSLKRVDPEGEGVYQSNLNAFQERLRKQLLEWESQKKSLLGKKLITYHKTWPYFSKWTGLQVIEEIEPLPGIPPSSKHVDQLLKIVKLKNINGILMASFYPHKVPHYLETKSGIPLILTPLGPGQINEQGFFDYFGTLLDVLSKKLK